ncbi:plasmodesmata callose-binding protein 3 [Dichanthelium oligosanthes]|uniref:Plasmodesmata callose-binding protein 3 n=1 Tax=Dichanthelium oligosanthes TaxID=888268 RepID=A0A1E5UQ26_9POAL|nr:plasmodesmata callose-binding protein 3 [Dichanthelium oligosanthes]
MADAARLILLVAVAAALAGRSGVSALSRVLALILSARHGFLFLFLAIFSETSFLPVAIGFEDGAWCVCRTDLGDTALQKTLDYACGAGADCKPTLQNGPCFAPDNVKAHCSYAVNSFYQRNNQNAQACVFSGTATLTNTDPSGNGCTFPATPSAAATSTGGSPGVYSPPTMGPSALNDNSGAGALPVAGLAARLVVLASCSFVALYLSA